MYDEGRATADVLSQGRRGERGQGVRILVAGTSGRRIVWRDVLFARSGCRLWGAGGTLWLLAVAVMTPPGERGQKGGTCEYGIIRGMGLRWQSPPQGVEFRV